MRYRNIPGSPIKLTRLGTSEWEQIQKKVKVEVFQVAKELLMLYAKRKHDRGFAFPKDPPLQKEMESLFPHMLTPDQEKAILEIKRGT